MQVEAKKLRIGAVLFLFAMMNAIAGEAQAPSLAFLEYLGQFQTDDGEWVDPLEVDAMSNESITATESASTSLDTSASSGANSVSERENR